MDSEARIKKIAEEARCPLDVARIADAESGGDLELAIRIAKRKGNVLYSGGKSGLYVEESPSKKTITQYKNGVLVDDKFYDFSVDNNIRLKGMLEEKTFDASLLEQDGDSVEVIYSEKLEEEYKVQSERASKSSAGSSFVGKGRRIGS